MVETAQQQDPGQKRWNRLSLAIMGAGVTALIAAIVLFVLTLTGSVGDQGYSGPNTATALGLGIEAVFSQTPPPTETAAPLPTATPSEAPIARLAIPRFGVDAPVVVRGMDANGVMLTPDGPTDVAWYDFTARPGFGSNAVFSGHVDYINYGAAVFANLNALEIGDIVEIRLNDSTVYRYSVITREQVFAATADVASIVGATPREIITLITCGGTFDGAQYDQRVIVQAERIQDEAPPEPLAGASSAP